ncbi:phosphatidylinositol 3,4,5-trisphosphate 3-phosphatase TPTE2-like isoform X2 [Chlorocebus sabaeus]|uniref:phosphatidylinositol 3,4,5-trisphosphate 3-phosphatase TPTE2-like isoform X2 n=1 Tax=Chlorocebus sabaeus TaxID=60711 RepID=UPI003BF971CE
MPVHSSLVPGLGRSPRLLESPGCLNPQWKGRTGTVVCAFLIASELFLTAKNRYVGYFAQVKHIYNWNLPPRRILFIKAFIIYSIHGIS